MLRLRLLLILRLQWCCGRDFAAPGLAPDRSEASQREEAEEPADSTPTWFWANRSKAPPAVRELLPAELQRWLPNLVVTGPETTGSSAMITQLARHPGIVQLGEMCWLSRDKELEQLAATVPRYAAESFREIEAERASYIRRGSGTPSLVRVGTNTESASYSLTTACPPMDPTAVRIRAEKCQNYFHHPFAPFWVRRASDKSNPTKVVFMYRNPVARACSRYSEDHRLASSGGEHPLFGDMKLVRNYRSCRATHLERHICRKPRIPFSASASVVCERLDSDKGRDALSVVDKERMLSDALYGLGTADEVLFRIEQVEWDVLWRCYRPFRLIRHAFYPALYSEHLRRWSAVVGADRILLVSQEDLLDHPEDVMRRVWTFAGLNATCAIASTNVASNSLVITKTRSAADVTIDANAANPDAGGTSGHLEDFRSTNEFQEGEQRPDGIAVPSLRFSLSGSIIVNPVGNIDLAPSALEYGRRRCSTSLINADLIHSVYSNSIREFYAQWMGGLDLGWDKVLQAPEHPGAPGSTMAETIDV